METQTDQQLLRSYTGSHSEGAFTELVRRHVDLVYSAARRMVSDSHQAEDVTQRVFMALAQNAGQLTGHPVLSGWLHRTTRNLAANAVRANVRRQIHEQEAAAMNEILSAEPDAGWEHIVPRLDAALDELNEAERDAILLRYFEKKSAPEMAGILGISDEAAQKRVSRAVEHLREYFHKHGVTAGASGLAVLISANAVQAAPTSLLLTISASALAGTTVSASAVIAATTKTIAMTTLQKIIIGTALTAAVGTGIFEASQAARLRAENRTLQQQQAPLAGQIQQLQGERDDATNQVAALTDDKSELLKLRGEVGVLRNQLQTLKAQAVQQAVTARSATQTQQAGGFISKKQLSSVGFQTPENAYQSFMNAMVSGQYDQVVAAMAPEVQTDVSTAEARKQFDEMRRNSAMDDFQGSQILAKKTLNDDHIDLEAITFVDGKGPLFSIQHMVKTGNEWRFRGSASMDPRTWDEGSNVEAVLPAATP